ncbi:hypothetical protein L596_029312 [Steinernema carpocapsae]|uniref:Uncharacterized protein n=1 Tax=Steinernema carpocapsae TaxID=34508 RepID=A0A4U5LU97_STECR|nr:hypothetical protein L596_029312 [Steinernema carpocapsae]
MSVMGYFGPSMEVAAFFVTILAAIVILVQKIKFGVAFKISPIEIRLLVQGILIMVPMSFVSVTGLTLSTEMNSIPAFYVIWHLINALIPVVNLLVWVVFNPAARWHLLKVFKEKPTKNFSKPVSNVIRTCGNGELNKAWGYIIFCRSSVILTLTFSTRGMFSSNIFILIIAIGILDCSYKIEIDFFFYLDGLTYSGPEQFYAIMTYFEPAMELEAFVVLALDSGVNLIQMSLSNLTESEEL